LPHAAVKATEAAASEATEAATAAPRPKTGTPTDGYELTREAAMAAFAKGGGSERRGQAGWRLDSERFRPTPKDLRALSGHPERAVSWHSGFREGSPCST
jgi:hypothetical protein